VDDWVLDERMTFDAEVKDGGDDEPLRPLRSPVWPIRSPALVPSPRYAKTRWLTVFLDPPCPIVASSATTWAPLRVMTFGRAMSTSISWSHCAY
jgi:recombinase-like zinc beta ribbon protein